MMLFDLLIEALYPRGLVCLGCGVEGPLVGDFCPECAREMQGIRMGTCVVCGRPTGRRQVCSSCQKLRPPIIGGMAVYGYHGKPRELLHRCKFKGHRYLTPFFGKQIALRVMENRMDFDVIVPVPSHILRTLGRGYCVAGEIAKEAAKQLNMPIETGVLRRVRWRRARFKLKTNWNLKLAEKDYALCHGERVKGKRVLLVDDILTGGSTLAACAGHLMDAGAVSVTSVVVAAVPKVRYNIKSKGSVVVSRSQSRAKRST